MKIVFCFVILALFIITQQDAFADSGKLKISSPAFKDGGIIPKKFTCDGQNISPPLKIENVPKNAKVLVLVVDDPDAPRGTFTHWLVWNIPTKTTKLLVGQKGFSQGTNDAGTLGYAGPCPPSGTHRYYFSIYALDSQLDLSTKSKRKDLQTNIQNHIIQKATLLARYSRS